MQELITDLASLLDSIRADKLRLILAITLITEKFLHFDPINAHIRILSHSSSQLHSFAFYLTIKIYQLFLRVKVLDDLALTELIVQVLVKLDYLSLDLCETWRGVDNSLERVASLW